MFQLLRPDLVAQTLSHEDLEGIIKRENLDYLILDCDSTLTAYHKDELLEHMVKAIKGQKVRKYVISNRLKSRRDDTVIKRIEEELDAEIIPNTGKPFHKINIKGKGAIIGDCLFTDVIFGNLNKLYTIKVDPQAPEPGIFTPYRKFEAAMQKLTFTKPSELVYHFLAKDIIAPLSRKLINIIPLDDFSKGNLSEMSSIVRQYDILAMSNHPGYPDAVVLGVSALDNAKLFYSWMAGENLYSSWIKPLFDICQCVKTPRKATRNDGFLLWKQSLADTWEEHPMSPLWVALTSGRESERNKRKVNPITLKLALRDLYERMKEDSLADIYICPITLDYDWIPDMETFRRSREIMEDKQTEISENKKRKASYEIYCYARALITGRKITANVTYHAPISLKGLLEKELTANGITREVDDKVLGFISKEIIKRVDDIVMSGHKIFSKDYLIDFLLTKYVDEGGHEDFLRGCMGIASIQRQDLMEASKVLNEAIQKIDSSVFLFGKPGITPDYLSSLISRRVTGKKSWIEKKLELKNSSFQVTPATEYRGDRMKNIIEYCGEENKR